MQKIREMRLAKAGLAGQQGDAESPPLYPSQQFQAEPFVHLRKIHVENSPPAMGTTGQSFPVAKLLGPNGLHFQRLNDA
jgi:hypothetical protein